MYPEQRPEQLVDILQWGALQLGNTGGYFAGCTNLSIAACVYCTITRLSLSLSVLFD